MSYTTHYYAVVSTGLITRLARPSDSTARDPNPKKIYKNSCNIFHSSAIKKFQFKRSPDVKSHVKVKVKVNSTYLL